LHYKQAEATTTEEGTMKKLTATIGGALTMQAFCLTAPLMVLIAATVMLGGAVTLFVVEGR